MPDLATLRLLCALHWNPIGLPMANLADEAVLGYAPLPADEYDNYLLHIAAFAANGAPDADILTYMHEIAHGHIGMTHPAGNPEAFLRALRAAMARH